LAIGDKISAQQLLLDIADTGENTMELQPLEQAERQLVEKAMAVTSGQVIEAAKLLDISRNALYRRLDKFGIKHES
jgi:transcriptional regulator of acetoin/glycerol metabolism